MSEIYQTQTKRRRKTNRKCFQLQYFISSKGFNEQDFNEPIKLMAENM